MNQSLKWTDNLVNRFWNYYSNYPEYYFTYQYGKNIVNEFSKHFHNQHEILDYGCGTGFLIEHLLKQNVNVYGTDVAENSVELVNKKYAASKNFKGAFLLADLITSARKFDVICVVEVIEHLTDANLDQLLQNISRLLKPGGLVIFTTPNNEKLSDSIVFCPNCEHTFHRWQHIRSWTSESLAAFLDKKGFEVKSTYVLNFAGPRRKSLRELVLFFRKKNNASSSQPHLVAVCSS